MDTYDLFADSTGHYAAHLTDATGTSVLMRADDGVHLTPAGGDRMGAAVFAALDSHWRIRAQAVPGHVQPVLKTQGSSQVPGTARQAPNQTTVTTRPRRSTSGSTGTVPGATTPSTAPSSPDPTSTTTAASTPPTGTGASGRSGG